VGEDAQLTCVDAGATIPALEDLKDGQERTPTFQASCFKADGDFVSW